MSFKLLVKASSSPFRIAARMSLASRWSTQAARWSSDSSHKVLPNVVGVYEAPKETDDRSPCPGLNALANHGYLPRDGRNISARDIVKSVTEKYGLSKPLASLVAYGTLLLIKKPLFQKITLKDLASNPGVEHCASLAHANTPSDAKHGATKVCPILSKQLLEEARDGGYTAEDFARIRVRRENEPGSDLQGWRSEIARGECSLTMNAFAGKDEKLSDEVVKTWWIGERLPDGYKPLRKTTLRSAAKVASKIRETMKQLNKEKGGK